jgi:hypothetical protein
MARRGGTPSSFNQEGVRESNIRSETFCTSTITEHSPYSPYFDIANLFEKSTRLPYYRGLFCGIVLPFATLADPAADIADRKAQILESAFKA